MARDVEFNVTASDKTGSALASAERKFKASQDRMRKEQNKALKDFEKTAGTIAGAGSKVGVLFGEQFAGALAKVAPAATPILAGVAVAAAPIIGASIAGAIIGGVGIGGVIGGVILAAKDPRVQTAGKDLGERLTGQLTARASVFVEPVLAGIKTIEKSFDRADSSIAAIFRNTSKFVAPLVQGVTYAFERIAAGAARLTAGAAPVIEAISRGIAELGSAVEDVFDGLADDGVSAASALTGVFNALATTIRIVGGAINLLTESYGVLAKYGAFGRDAQLEFLRMEANAKLATAATDAAGSSLQDFSGVAKAAKTAIGAVADEVNRLTSENRSLYGSQVAAAEAIANATKTIRENGRGLSLNTERGRENRKALDSVANSLAQNYANYVKVNGAGEGAARVAAKNRSAFVALAEKAGYAAGEARRLADRLLGIPAKRTPVVNLKDNASKGIQTVISRLAAVRSKTVTVNVAVRQSGDASALRKQNLPAFSAATFAGVSAQDAGRYRTGGPSPVSVQSQVDVFLDGAPFTRAITRAVSSSERRQAWRQKVGTR